MRTQFKLILKTLAFLALIAFTTLRLWGVYGFNDNVHSKAVFRSFYSLPPQTLDAVWIGPSSVRFALIPSEAYSTTGVSLFGLMTGNQPFQAARYLIEECEKTQHPAVYLVDIRSLVHDESSLQSDMMRITSNMNPSQNRLAAIRGMEGKTQLETLPIVPYFDLYQFHTRRDINSTDFGHDPFAFLGYSICTHRMSADLGSIQRKMKLDPKPIDAANLSSLEELIAYGKDENLRIAFTSLPSNIDETEFARLNYVKQWLKSHDVPLIDFDSLAGEVGIDYTTDLADTAHLNVFGARKLTTFAARYLQTHYQLTDHRDDERFAQFEDAQSRFTARYTFLTENKLDVYEDYEPGAHEWRDANFDQDTSVVP